jgi:hypothetical protein
VSGAPSKSQIKAVRKALYQRDRLGKLNDLARNISVLMNFNPATELPINDVRNPAGSGPTWFVPATGAVDPGVLEAANDCDTIAATLMAIRHDVGQVSFPSSDKQHLMASLQAEATSWNVRGAMWRSPTAPDVEAFTKEIGGHVATAISEAEHVAVYLKTKRAVGI